jgi:hypothetical protein
MSNHRRRPVTRTSTEHTIGEVSLGHVDGDPLTKVLAAAKPVPVDHETDGEQSAVMALRAAREGTSVRATIEPAVRKFARALTVKVAVVLAVLAGGGVAVASGAASIPQLFGHGGSAHTHARPTPGSASSTSGNPQPATSDEATNRAQSGSPPVSAATEELIALCVSYQALPPGQRAKALGTPGFASLVDAAGGRGHVAAYCAGLSSPNPKPHTTGPPAAHPTHPAHPSHPAKSPHPHSSH